MSRVGCEVNEEGSKIVLIPPPDNHPATIRYNGKSSTNPHATGVKRPPLCMGIVWMEISIEKNLSRPAQKSIFWRTKNS
jgi:hypothetical protein